MRIACTLLLACVVQIVFSQNPQLLKDVYPGATSSNPGEIVKTSGYTFFTAEDDDADLDKGLFRTDGTPGGTIKLVLTDTTYISTIATMLTPFGNKIVFAGDNLKYYGEIWVSDGTQAGTRAIERFLPTPVNNLNRLTVMAIAALDTVVLYSARDAADHFLLKKTNGTPGNSTLLYDFGTFGSTASEITLFKVVNNILYFIAYNAGTGVDQLWRSDGTTAGTYLVKDFTTSRYVASYLMPAGNMFYIMLVEPGIGNVLWKSDGTPAGTMPVKTIGTSGNNNYPENAAIGNTLYFAGLNTTYGKELWKTDGTDTGTIMVADVLAGSGSSNPTQLTSFNGSLYFVAAGDTVGSELWKYSGGGNFSLVKDIYPGSTGSSIAALKLCGNSLVFRANGNNGFGNELWVSNGTAAGTRMIADINPGISGSNTTIITGGAPAYLNATTDSYGNEIYKFDPYNVNTSRNFYVNDNSTVGDVFVTAIGSNANTGTLTAPFATIQHASNIAQAGDTIFVDAGNYAEQVTLTKGLAIIGAGSSKTHLSKPDSIYAPPGNFTEKGLIQTAQNIGDVHISNMHITGDFALALTPVIIQSGGSVKNSWLQSGNQGVYFILENTARSALVEKCRIQAEYVGVNFSGYHLNSSLNSNEITVNNSGYSVAAMAGTGFKIPSFTALNNIFKGFKTQGISMNCDQATIQQNFFAGNGTMLLQQNDTSNTKASCNWWGSNIIDSIAPRLSGIYNFTPFLSNGWDNDTSAVGFQLMSNSCNAGGIKRYVNDGSTIGDRFTTAVGNDNNLGTAASPWASLYKALIFSASGDTILVDAGVYNAGTISITKPISLLGATYNISANDASNPMLPNDRGSETELPATNLQIQSSNVVVKGFAFNSGASSAITVNNGAISDLLIENNYFAASNGTIISISGPAAADTAKQLAGDFYINNNRFDKITTGSGISIQAGNITKLTAYGNAFVLSAATPRTQVAFALGQAGIINQADISNNHFDRSNYDVFSYKLQNGIFNYNKSFSSSRAFLLQCANSMPASFSIIGNEMQVTGTAPRYSMGFFATDSIFKNAPKKVEISNNNISIDGTGSLITQNPISVGFYTPSTQTSFICKNNKLLLTGSYAAQSTSIGVQGISVAGRAKEIVIEGNELINSGTNLPNTPKPDSAQQLVHPGIYISTDNGPTNMLAEGSLDINHNIINGFKQSVVFYDGATTSDSYKGYGNVKGGYKANINYNSFGGDSISINNGPVGQIVNATCNWYGTTDLAAIGNKISKSTVRYTPVLTGADQLPDLGYQPPANSCMSIIGFIPAEGAPGVVVQVKGAGFTDATQVAFNGINAGFSISNDSTIVATVPAGSHTGTIMIGKAAATIVSAQNFMVLPEPTADSVGICPGSNSLLVSNVIGNTYQWQMLTDTGSINIVDDLNFSGYNNDSLRLLDVPTEWNGRQMRCIINGGSYSKTFTLKVVNYWTGNGNDNNWNNPLNWGCSGQVPDINTDVVIGAGSVQLSGQVEAKSIWATPGTNVTVAPGTQIIIKPQ